MTHINPSWYIITHHDPSWPTITHHDSSWPIMTHHNPSWPIMTHHNPSWPSFFTSLRHIPMTGSASRYQAPLCSLNLSMKPSHRDLNMSSTECLTPPPPSLLGYTISTGWRRVFKKRDCISAILHMSHVSPSPLMASGHVLDTFEKKPLSLLH